MQQHPLGRIDAQPLEQFGIAQRQLDHLAQLIDRRGHAADIVIGDVRAARLLRLFIFRAQLDLGILVDMDDALGAGRDDRKADFLQRIGRRAEILLDVGRDVVDALLPRGRDDVALAQRTADERALQGVGGTLQPQILLCGREHHALRSLRLGTPHLDEFARSSAGVGALQTVEPNDLQPFILGIRVNGAGGRGALSDDLDDIALGQPQRRHQRARQMRQSAAAVFGAGVGDLDLAGGRFAIGHRQSSCGS